MRKLKLSTFLDGAFIFTLSFFIFYSLLVSGIGKIFPTLLVSVIISMVITFSFCLLMEKHFSKKDILLSEKKRYDGFLKTLYLSTDKEVCSLIKSYYQKTSDKAIIKGGGVFVEDKNLYAFFSFTPEKVNVEKVLCAYKKTPKGVKTVFIGNEFESSVLEFFSGFEKVKLYTAKDFYLRLNEEELLPEISEKAKKRKFKNPFKNAFKKENSKKFFIWGVVFLLFSTVTYFRWFYLILGAIFLTISSYLRFYKNFPQKQKADLS